MSCKNPILLVEDDPDLMDNMAYLLESEGYTVLRAINGKEALELLRALSKEQLPKCILLDLMMPVMDGKTFLETLLRDHPHDLAKIAIVVATAKGSPTKDFEKLPLAVEKVRKPIEIDEFLSVIEKHCG